MVMHCSNGPNTLQVEQQQSSRAPSPAASTRSRNAPSRAENMSGTLNDNGVRRDQNARISYFDPSNQATLERLILGIEQTDTEGEEENAQATLANVEEMIEGYEWASDDIMGRKMTRGAVDMIEARLMDELMALEKVGVLVFCKGFANHRIQANIHSFLESDDRVGAVMKYMDEAVAELDNMETLISTYKIHLNVSRVSPKVSYSTHTLFRPLGMILFSFNLKTEVFKCKIKIRGHF